MSSCPLSLDGSMGESQKLRALGSYLLYAAVGGVSAAVINGFASSILTGSWSLSPATKVAVAVGGLIIVLSSSFDGVAHAVKPDYDSKRIWNIAKYVFLGLSSFVSLGNLGGNAFSLTQRMVLSLLPVSLDYLAMSYYFHKNPPVLVVKN